MGVVPPGTEIKANKSTIRFDPVAFINDDDLGQFIECRR
jgi:hypothetical protein